MNLVVEMLQIPKSLSCRQGCRNLPIIFVSRVQCATFLKHDTFMAEYRSSTADGRAATTLSCRRACGWLDTISTCPCFEPMEVMPKVFKEWFFDGFWLTYWDWSNPLGEIWIPWFCDLHGKLFDHLVTLFTTEHSFVKAKNLILRNWMESLLELKCRFWGPSKGIFPAQFELSWAALASHGNRDPTEGRKQRISERSGVLLGVFFMSSCHQSMTCWEIFFTSLVQTHDLHSFSWKPKAGNCKLWAIRAISHFNNTLREEEWSNDQQSKIGHCSSFTLSVPCSRGCHGWSLCRVHQAMLSWWEVFGSSVGLWCWRGHWLVLSCIQKMQGFWLVASVGRLFSRRLHCLRCPGPNLVNCNSFLWNRVQLW